MSLASGRINLRNWEMNNLVLRDSISQEKSLNDIYNKNADQSTYAQSLLRFNSHKFRKELRVNRDNNNDFLVY